MSVSFPRNPEAVIADRLAGMTLNELAEKYRVPRGRVQKWLTSKGIKLSQEQILENCRRRCACASRRSAIAASRSKDPGADALREMVEAGMTRPQIADKLGVAHKTVSAYLQDHKISTNGTEAGHPGRRQIRAAIAKTDTRSAAADSLGMSVALFAKLCEKHGIADAGNKGRAVSKKRMSEMARAGAAEARAAKANHSKIVGTDMRAMIEECVRLKRVTLCPPAFAEITTRDPLSDQDRKALAEHARQRDAA